jgi:electron transport complex protein RnfD
VSERTPTPGGSRYLQMELRTSPHLARGLSVEVIMRNVVYALAPLVVMAVYAFGLSAALLIAVTTASALLTEYAVTRIAGTASTLGDFSAAITGLLLGLTLPPAFPLWMAALGGVVSIALGKSLFGGLGYNVFNPALVGRAFLQAAFPVAITSWSEPFQDGRFASLYRSTAALPFMKPLSDAATGATPLAAFKFEHKLTEGMDLLLGSVSGSSGETSALIILLGGIYLASRRMLDWRIPVGMLGTVAALAALLHWLHPEYPPPLFMLLSGGLMLGAVYMATDMVTSPVTPLGVWLFAVFIGVVTVVIRVWGGLPEGVMYAILLGNAVTPLLNLVTQPRIYGARRRS